ncbi:MAG: type II secretion system protein [Thermodesulfobacteriota bacterium]
MRRSTSQFSSIRSLAPHGFTLIEMAVVLIIVGIIAALTIPLVGEKLKQDKLSKSRGTLNALRQEIIGFALANKVLPGEAAVETSFANARDAQQNYIAYYVDPNLKSGDFCTQTSTNYALTIGGTTYSNLAFIIASRGGNQNLQIDADSTGSAPASRTVVSYSQGTVTDTANGNPPNTSQTYDLPGPASATDEFDDLVDYVTLDYLKSRVCDATASEPINGILPFKDMAASFPKSTTQNFVANNVGAVNVGANELSFGNGYSNTRACIWYDGTYPATNNDELQCESNANSVTICQGRDKDGAGGSTYRWDKLRFVFRFNVLNADARVDSYAFMGGIVFAIINGADLQNVDSTPPCGGGGGNDGFLGYANTGIYNPKLGVEIDLYPNDDTAGTDNQNDPGPNESSFGITWAVPAACSGSIAQPSYANHVAPVFFQEGDADGGVMDNRHGEPSANTDIRNPYFTQIEDADCNGAQDSIGTPALYDGFLTNATAYEDGTPDRNKQWLEDATNHWIRMEIHRGLAVDATHGAGNRYKYTVKIWMDDTPNASFLNLAADLGENLANADMFDMYSVWLTSALSAELNTFRFGWTMAIDTNGAAAAVVALLGGSNPGGQTVSVADFGFNGTSTACVGCP